jgi:hypothetical protein
MKAQTRARVDKVKEHLLTGAPIRDIAARLSAEFGILPKSMGYFITKAYRELEKEADEEKLIRQKIRLAKMERESTQLIGSELEIDSYLSQIVRGERPDEKVVSTSSGAEVVKVAVNSVARLRAMKLLYDRLDQQKRFYINMRPPDSARILKMEQERLTALGEELKRKWGVS